MLYASPLIKTKQHTYTNQGQKQAEHPPYGPGRQMMDGSRTKGRGQRAQQCNSSQCRQVYIAQCRIWQTTPLTQYNERQ